MISTDTKFINIHYHQDNPDNGWQLRSLDITEITANPAFISSQFIEQQPVSIGIHPWFIDRQPIEQSLQRLQSLCKPANVIAIGECGLDKCIQTDLGLQIEVFSRQIDLAERLSKPVIVHCVRAFNELLQLHKQLRPAQPWIVHGFVGKAPLARKIVSHGLYVSFGKALLDQHSQAGRALQAIPLEKVFLETDDSAYEISEIYAAAAKILGLDLTTLQLQLVANFQRVFAHD